MDRVLEMRLLPRVAEALARAEPVERDMERRYLQLVIQGPEGMLVEGLRGQRRIPVPERMSDTLRGEAVHVGDAAPLVAGIKVRCPIQEPVPMQDGQRTPDGTGVAFRDGAAPQKSGRVVRAEAEKLREEFEEPLLGRIGARQLCAAMRGRFMS